MIYLKWFSEIRKLRIYPIPLLNPYPWIFGTITERVFWKKIQNTRWWHHSWDLENKNNICRWSVSWANLWCRFQMAYAAYDMPICEERWRAEQKYMPFFGTVTERAFWKKTPKHSNIYKWQNAALWIFSAKCARWRSCVLDFFRIHRFLTQSYTARMLRVSTIKKLKLLDVLNNTHSYASFVDEFFKLIARFSHEIQSRGF